ncbi:MAG: GGDEF domain-containing protein [Lachnospiraceae bacterium]|nr:GGDEF domain-containing protein [Lachnospiraceae bacterium]
METQKLYLSIINNLQDGVYFVDNERHIRFWNKAAEKITGYSAEEIVGKSCQLSNLNHIDEDGRPLCQVGCPLFATIIDGKQRNERVFVRHKDGYRIPVQVNIMPMSENGEVIGAIEIFTPSSPTQYEDDLVENLSGIAMHDTLTGLPNRRYLESFLNYKLDEFSRFNKPFAVVFADIDNFSEFNNSYGHDVGDAVLKSIASSLRTNTRKNDLIGRWGGEEFLGVLTVNTEYDGTILAEKIRQLVAGTEVMHEGELLNVSISIGVTTVTKEDDADKIVKRADALMYQSKQNGKNRVTSG